MNGDQFVTPANRSQNAIFSLRSTAAKRDSLAAELERDPQLSTAKRQQRTQVFTSTIAHANLERQLLAAQTTKMELETKLRDRDLQVERLERDRRWFADRHNEEREEKEKERAEHEEEKSKTDSDLRSLRNSLSSIREELADLQDAHSSLQRSTSQTIASQKSQITTLTHQCSLFQEELSQAQEIANARSVTIDSLEAQLPDLNTSQTSLLHSTSEEQDMRIVREELHRQADYLRTVESKNAKLMVEVNVLRAKETSVEVLREEKLGLERKVRVMEELREKVVRLEAEVEAGRREREAWANNNNTAESSPSSASSKTPVSITKNLSDLRLAHARLLEDHGANAALLRRRETEIGDLERRESEAQLAIEALQEDMQALSEKVGRREQRAILAEREVGFLNALVASFNAEEANREGAVLDTSKIQRIQQLETLLQEFKDANTQLMKEVDALGGRSVTLGRGKSREALSAEIEEAQKAKLEMHKALEAAEAESKQHFDKIEELEQSLFELTGEIGAGRHVPPGVRVLSLKDNPEQQWVDLRQSVMDRLKGENEALMKRLKELEESGARVEGKEGVQGEAERELVPRESWELVTKEKTELEEVVRQKEKRLLRLQQIFRSKSAEFREAIASILGLKLAFYDNGQVRVTSIYDLNAAFVFQPTSNVEGVKMQLVAQGEGGPQDLPNLMQYWIENEQCIPGFLASLTLECYDKSKRSVGNGSGVGL